MMRVILLVGKMDAMCFHEKRGFKREIQFFFFFLEGEFVRFLGRKILRESGKGSLTHCFLD